MGYLYNLENLIMAIEILKFQFFSEIFIQYLVLATAQVIHIAETQKDIPWS